jgi:hypothetical protein
MDAHTRDEDALELRELSVDEREAVSGGWPKWLERLFDGGGSRTPAQMANEAKKGWPAGSHWTDF